MQRQLCALQYLVVWQYCQRACYSCTLDINIQQQNRAELVQSTKNPCICWRIVLPSLAYQLCSIPCNIVVYRQCLGISLCRQFGSGRLFRYIKKWNLAEILCPSLMIEMSYVYCILIYTRVYQIIMPVGFSFDFV